MPPRAFSTTPAVASELSQAAAPRRPRVPPYLPYIAPRLAAALAVTALTLGSEAARADPMRQPFLAVAVGPEVTSSEGLGGAGTLSLGAGFGEALGASPILGYDVTKVALSARVALADELEVSPSLAVGKAWMLNGFTVDADAGVTARILDFSIGPQLSASFGKGPIGARFTTWVLVAPEVEAGAVFALELDLLALVASR